MSTLNPYDVFIRLLATILCVSLIGFDRERSGRSAGLRTHLIVDEATKASMSEAVKLLSQALNYSWEDAYMLGSLVINGQISQCVNPMKTVRAEIPQSIATTEQIIAALN